MTPSTKAKSSPLRTTRVAVYQTAGERPDPSAVVWLGRMQFDAVTIGYAAARAKHLAA